MSDPLLAILIDTGLSEHEARVYHAALLLGPSTVLKIARESGVKRTTVYSVIDSLKQKGLMAVELKGFKQVYVAEDPKKLESVLAEKKQTLHARMPQLSALYNLQGGESVVKYYEGLEGVKNVYESLLTTRLGEKYYVVSNIEEWYALDPEYFEHFLARRAKKNITTKLLLQDSPKAREYKKFARNYASEVKLLPQGTSLSTNFVVVPNKVLIHQLHPPVLGIVLENTSAIKMHQEFFEIMWNALEG